MSETVTVRFLPQAWVNDYANVVDPVGPATFTVPAGDWLEGHSYASDRLRTHEYAPEWIRAWSGLFAVEIEHP